MADDLNLSAFAGQLQTKFQMRLDPESALELELIQVEEHRATEQAESFSLLFLAPAGAPPVQRIYRLEHERLGELDLFLVPVARDGQGLYYEAVFNRVRPAQ
jgi:hypothetical protein